MKLVAVTELRYDAKNLHPGDEFEARDDHALIFKGLGKAKDAPPKVTTKLAAPREDKPSEKLPLSEPPAETVAPASEERPAGRRRYMRRDLTAED